MESKHDVDKHIWHIPSPSRLLVLLPHLLHGKIVLSTFFHQSGFQTCTWGYLWFIYWIMIKLRDTYYLWYLEALHMCTQQIASGATAVKSIAKWGKYGNTEDNSLCLKPFLTLDLEDLRAQLNLKEIQSVSKATQSTLACPCCRKVTSNLVF